MLNGNLTYFSKNHGRERLVEIKLYRCKVSVFDELFREFDFCKNGRKLSRVLNTWKILKTPTVTLFLAFRKKRPRRSVLDIDAPKGRPVPFILAEGYMPTWAGGRLSSFVRRDRPVPAPVVYTYIFLKFLESLNRVLQLSDDFLLKDHLKQIILFSEVNCVCDRFFSLQFYHHKDPSNQCIKDSSENIFYYLKFLEIFQKNLSSWLVPKDSD